MRALIVDDERTNLLLVSSLVQKLGFSIETAEDGEQAWDAYLASPFPVVITDWLMPSMSGIDLCSRIRAHSAPREMPDGTLSHAKVYTFVLMVTSLGEEEHTVEAFRAGVDDMLVKPVDAVQLQARLRAGERMVREQAASAESALRSTVGSLQNVVGHESPALLSALDELVHLYRYQDADTKARAFLRRQLDIARTAHGASHVVVKKLQRDLDQLGGASVRPVRA